MLKEKQVRLLRNNVEFDVVDHMLNSPTITTTAQTNLLLPSAINWYVNSTGTGSGIAPGGDINNPGYISVQTGTVAGTSRTALTSFPSTSTGSIVLGVAAVELEMIFRFVVGTSAQDKEEWIGFIDSVTGAPASTGAYVYFDWSTNNANWVYIYKPTGSAGTVVASGFVADTNWLRLNIRFSKSPVKVTFSLNGGYAYTAPATFADGTLVGFGAVTKKYAGSVSQNLDIDFVRLSYNAS